MPHQEVGSVYVSKVGHELLETRNGFSETRNGFREMRHKVSVTEIKFLPAG